MLTVAWIGALALLWYLFDSYLTHRDNPNRTPEVRTDGTRAELVLQRNGQGHYVMTGAINGRTVTFLLDTGATLVSVPAHLGPALGLEPGAYHEADTANGPVTVRATRIDELAIGPFVLRDIRADLNPGIRFDEVLLGMSALKHLEFTQRGDQLILRPLVADGT